MNSLEHAELEVGQQTVVIPDTGNQTDQEGSPPEQVYKVFHVRFASQGSDIVHDRNQAYNTC